MKRILATAVALGAITMAGNAMATNLITNGDFATGDFTGWNTSCIPGGADVVDTGTSYGYAALLDDPTSWGPEGLFQDFYIPNSISQITISFDYLFTGIDTNCLFDDSFESTFSFLQQTTQNCLWWTTTTTEWKDASLVSDSSSGSNYNARVHFARTFDLTNLVNIDPNGCLSFWLTEKLWNVCNLGLNSCVYLDNICVTDVNDPNPCPVPEPATMLLFGTGLVGLAGYRRKKSKNA